MIHMCDAVYRPRDYIIGEVSIRFTALERLVSAARVGVFVFTIIQKELQMECRSIVEWIARRRRGGIYAFDFIYKDALPFGACRWIILCFVRGLKQTRRNSAGICLFVSHSRRTYRSNYDDACIDRSEFWLLLTCVTSAFVSGVVLSWNTFRNSRGLLDVLQNSLADMTNCCTSCKLCSAYSADTEHFSIRCDASSSTPLAHQLFA